MESIEAWGLPERLRKCQPGGQRCAGRKTVVEGPGEERQGCEIELVTVPRQDNRGNDLK